jgi:hypothetical protein
MRRGEGGGVWAGLRHGQRLIMHWRPPVKKARLFWSWFLFKLELDLFLRLQDVCDRLSSFPPLYDVNHLKLVV